MTQAYLYITSKNRALKNSDFHLFFPFVKGRRHYTDFILVFIVCSMVFKYINFVDRLLLQLVDWLIFYNYNSLSLGCFL